MHRSITHLNSISTESSSSQAGYGLYSKLHQASDRRRGNLDSPCVIASNCKEAGT